MNAIVYSKVRAALEQSWSAETSVCYSLDAFPSYGQCAQTAIIIQEKFGGEILRTTGWHGQGNHFYNQINGERVDFTANQFTMPDYSYALIYEDQPSNADDAAKECLPRQVEALRRAFQKAYEDNAV